MGTILSRRRKDGSTAYMGKIILRRDGAVTHRESQTFDRQRDAKRWLAQREGEIATSGLPSHGPPLGDAIRRYIEEDRRGIGRTKDGVLAAILRHSIAMTPCGQIGSAEIIRFAQELGASRKPQTVANWLSHLASVFAIARPAWGLPLDPEAMQAARAVMGRMGITGRPERRTRRPTVEEMDRLMWQFSRRAPQAMPMHRVVMFAMFSSRRQDEIVSILWADLEPGRVLVRDMKHPGGTRGNDIWCDLPPEAEAVIQSMPRRSDRVFPWSADAVQAAWATACKLTGIEGLRFHDLRHEAVSRLFEMGWTIPQVSSVSGHRSWSSLQRYAHLRHTGDRWAGWSWLEDVRSG